MAYNYLELVNDVNRRLNEVELTSSNFASATGYYSFAKDAINSSIRHIQQEEFEWPWNHVEETETLTAGTVRYSYPYDAKTINMNSFRIKRSASLNVSTQKLKIMAYEEWLENHADSEHNTTNTSVPLYIIRAPSREFILYPNPDQAYELIYEYYTVATDLELYTDVPNLPEEYRYLIIDGAMFYVYQFKGDMQASSIAGQKFSQSLKNLRSLYINRTDYVRDTRVHF
jgi:hypothetical protein